MELVKLSGSDMALEKLKILQKGYEDLPICMSKTPASISDNPKLIGAPKDYTFNVSDIKLSAGAGFIVVLYQEIL